MIQKAFGNETMDHMQDKEWFRWFKEEWTSVKSDEHSGRPSTSRNKLMIDTVCSAMLDNHRITFRQLSDKLGAFISFGTVHSDRIFGHITSLRQICPKTADSQAERDSPCSTRDWLQCAHQDANYKETNY